MAYSSVGNTQMNLVFSNQVNKLDEHNHLKFIRNKKKAFVCYQLTLRIIISFCEKRNV